MAIPRDIRRLAFQILYQLDARGSAAIGAAGLEANATDAEAVLASIIEHEEEHTKFTPAERKKAFLSASESFAHRADADAFMTEAAPGWPAHRQAAVDRAILRLAYHEMTRAGTHPKIVVNEAIELAKEFSTEKSPAFINGLLDKVLKKVLAEKGEVVEPAEPTEQPTEQA